jgi:hypothetical protein
MHKINSLSCFILALILVFPNVSKPSDIAVLKDSERFIESLEWDPLADKKVERYKKHIEYYLNMLTSKNEKHIFIASVMIGLLEYKDAIPLFKKAHGEGDLAATGLSFAACRLEYEYDSNYKKLEFLGSKIMSIGRAMSIKNIDALILMSFLKDERFLDFAYAMKEKTDEVWQSEAISIAIVRYQKIEEHSKK